jgi:hypothetical protein
MWIEDKGCGLYGPTRIGWAEVKYRGKRIDYNGRTFKSVRGYKYNYCDIESGDRYWITGCRKDGRNALYATDVVIDEGALKEYWLNIRKLPESAGVKAFRARGKYNKN